MTIYDNPIIHIICGPTSSGKTGYALKQIGDKEAIIITVDSRHLYQGLSITTGWDLDLTKNNIKYFGFGYFRPDQIANAVDYTKYVHQIIDENIGKKEIYLVGGSGFYLQSIIHPEIIDSVQSNPELRKRLEKMSVEELKTELKKTSPEIFSSLNNSDQNNPRRLIRRLEIISQPLVPSVSPCHRVAFPHPYQIICLPTPKNHQELINKRIEKRLSDGCLDEVKKLLSNYPDQSLPIYTAIGVKQMILFINGKISHEEMFNLWLIDELNYVKRQLTWFKKHLPPVISSEVDGSI